MNGMKAEPKRQRKSSNMRNKLNGWNTDNENDTCYSHQNQIRTRQALDLELPAEDNIEKNGTDAMQEAEEESELELTLAIGSNNMRRKKENSFTSDSGASFSSSSTESGGMKLNGCDWRLFQMPDIKPGSYRNERQRKFNGEEQISEEMVKQPPWLFQCLSLNMT